MYIALNSSGEEVEANTLEKNVFCPVCHEPLILKDGKINNTHYAHYPSSDCVITKDSRYTEDHGYIVAKVRDLLYNNKYLGNIETYKAVGTRYSDVAFTLNNGKKVNVNIITPKVHSTTTVLERMDYFQAEEYYNMNIFTAMYITGKRIPKGAQLTHKLSYGNCLTYDYTYGFRNNHFKNMPGRTMMKNIEHKDLPETWNPFINTSTTAVVPKYDPKGMFHKLHGNEYMVAWISTGKKWWSTTWGYYY